MSKKILILGAGNSQIDLINYCKSIGLETFGCSYTNTDTGIPLLDNFAQINIIDHEKIKDYFTENNIDYIYSVGSDIAVPTVCKVAEATDKFSFVSSKTAEVCCNKHLMRKALGDSKFNLEYFVCSSLSDIKKSNIFPAILKPVDSQGQRGVYLVNNEDDLKKHFDKSIAYSKSNTVIVEKYVCGSEISVNAYIKNGEVIFSIISDRESFDNLPGGIIKAHHLPSKFENTAVADKINELVKEAVYKFEINNGPVYFQIKVADNHPYLIEVTPRLDGCHMWNLINNYCNVNLLELTMNHFLGKDIKIENFAPINHPIHLDFFCEPPNTLFDADKYQKYVADHSFMYYKSGDTVKKLNGYMEKCGYRIYKSPCKIGVVGGSGFVGQSFAEQYKNDFEIFNISRQKGAVNEYSSKELEEALLGCDSVIILAAKKVNPKEDQNLELYLDNVTIVENTLNACKKLGIKNIVFTSSRCVYSNQQNSPIPENSKIEPINYYGISKSNAEQLCISYNEKFNMNIKILRIAQIISKDKNGYMIDKFISNALVNQPLTIYGKSLGKRDYIYIKDVCKAIYLSLLRLEQAGIFNIGSGIGTSSKELAQAIINGFESSSDIVALEDKPEDTSITFLDTTKAKNVLGFECDFSLNDAFKSLNEKM